MPDAIIYLGPSLPREEAELILPSGPQVMYLPPIRREDLLHAIALKPKVIGIIDGLFFQNAAVGHREILSALQAGIRVVGASSMGALRAAELESFGMEGIGEVFLRYLHGSIESDDEVALICDPETDIALSEALVNIRITLEKARSCGVITRDEESNLIESIKEQYYPSRSWEQVFWSGSISNEKTAILKEWLKKNTINQKRDDARSVLVYIREILKCEERTPDR